MSFSLRLCVSALKVLRSFALILLCAGSLLAQSPTATLVGRIIDPSGASVPGARVSTVNANTGERRFADSGQDGEYAIPSLAPGAYELTVEAQGFRPVNRTGLTLQVDQTARLDLQLTIGGGTEVVQVTADVPLVNVENASKGDVIVTEEITEMPLPSREFSDLAFLVPGVAREAQSGHGSAFAVNGARTDNTNFVIDGFNNQNPRGAQPQANPPLDAMQEFKMQTSGYSAEFGRLAGGVMNMVLKSGGNQFHGALFEFLRNDALDARGFFDPAKTPLRRNQFGASINGPIAKNRTFFLASWEAFRNRQIASRLARVPEMAARTGDYSADPTVLLKDPLAKGNCTAKDPGACFPGNRIPASRIHPVAAKMTGHYPVPNLPGQKNNFYSSASDRDNWDSFLGKVDHRLFAQDSLSVRFMERINDNINPFRGSDVPGFGSSMDQRQYLAGLTYTRIFSPTVINEFRTGINRTRIDENPVSLGRDYAADIGLPSSGDPRFSGYPRFQIRDLAILGDSMNLPIQARVNNYQWADTLTWVKQNHLLKFGTDILRSQFFEPDNSLLRGNFVFQGRWSGDSYADFLLGFPNSTSRQLGSTPVYLFSTHYGFFAQDDWKLTPRLTLNLGLRYEITTPLTEKYGRMATFIPEAGKIIVADDRTTPDFARRVEAAGMTDKIGAARDYGIPKGLVDTRYRRFAPRFGFAWRPAAANLVVRGGYGIFFAGSLGQPIRNEMSAVFPFMVSETYNRVQNNVNALTLSDPFPASRTQFDAVTNASGFEVHAPSQYLQSWNMTFERELGRQSAIEISYVGSKGTHLGRQYNINQPFRGPEYAQPWPRPYPGLNNINYFSFGSNSTYNAATFTVRRRFSSGLFFRAHYVYGKSIDDASEISNAGAGGYAGAQDARNLKLERGRSDWDTGHSLLAAFSYDLPLGSGRLLRGWQIAGTSRMYTGQPFTVRLSGVDVNLGEANRPDRIAKGTVSDPTPERWFDIAAFPAVPTGAFRFGNSGRNILDGPGSIGTNLSLLKRFPIRDRSYLQFRWEVFNATNHTNFRLPENNANAPNAATIVEAGSARTMQVALRFVF